MDWWIPSVKLLTIARVTFLTNVHVKYSGFFCNMSAKEGKGRYSNSRESLFSMDPIAIAFGKYRRGVALKCNKIDSMQ